MNVVVVVAAMKKRSKRFVVYHPDVRDFVVRGWDSARVLFLKMTMRVAHSSAFLYGVTRPLRDGGPRASSLSGGVVSSHAVGGY